MIKRAPAAFIAAMLAFAPLVKAATEAEVWKSPTCGCCIDWVKHLEANGFTAAVNNVGTAELMNVKKKLGLSDDLAACHTAKIEGYVIEGHVPATDIKRLLEEKPDALGLAVPGMPIGSPGMEQGGKSEPYEVLLVKKDGSTEIFASH